MNAAVVDPIFVAVAVGVPSEGVGVIGVDRGGVFDGVTVPVPADRGVPGLVVAAQAAVGEGAGMVEDAGLTGRPVVWLIEDLSPSKTSHEGAGRASKHHRASEARRAVQSANAARAVMHGAVTASITTGVPWLTVTAHAVPVDPPRSLVGLKPAGWRGGRGQRREVQRRAWAVAVAGAARLSPSTNAATVAVLADLIRSTGPDLGLRAACERALALVQPPSGVPMLTVDALVEWASKQGLVG